MISSEHPRGYYKKKRIKFYVAEGIAVNLIIAGLSLINTFFQLRLDTTWQSEMFRAISIRFLAIGIAMIIVGFFFSIGGLLSYFKLRNEERIEKDREREGKRDPKQKAISFHQMGLNFYHNRNFNRALDYLNKAIAKDPKNVRLFIDKGDVLKELKKIKEALLYFDQALNIDPTSREAIEKREAVIQILEKESNST
ncbi:MAG: tetratricopeptide repeat protein [Promethearchaeota archaeon]|jgi:tetratricopeptide (TPR) repeat protein